MADDVPHHLLSVQLLQVLVDVGIARLEPGRGVGWEKRQLHVLQSDIEMSATVVEQKKNLSVLCFNLVVHTVQPLGEQIRSHPGISVVPVGDTHTRHRIPLERPGLRTLANDEKMERFGSGTAGDQCSDAIFRTLSPLPPLMTSDLSGRV